jgi:hypothetical protein
MSFLAVLTIVPIVPVFGYADDTIDIIVSTDKASYKHGDFVTIKGSGAHSYTVFTTIISPQGEEIADLKFIAASNGDFSSVWIIPNGIEQGTYTIQIEDIIKKAQTTFQLGTVTISQGVQQLSDTTLKTPEWIKNVAEFWIADQIDDEGFVKVIEYLVKEEIITIPYAEAPEGDAETQIPSWIKTNTEFWITGDISDDEFTIGLEWLINNGVIRVQDVGGVSVSVYKIEGKYYPIDQFHLTPISPDCPDYHLHATSGYTVNAVLTSFTDHNPGSCGLGTIDSIIQQQYIMTENQILEWKMVTGIKISAK